MDKLDKSARSYLMSLVKSTDTAPEISVRKVLFRRGFRYRLHNQKLPGKPDLVFPKYNAVIFIHGCFWHRHDCKHAGLPSSNKDFWQTKLTKNVDRDSKNLVELENLGWRVRVIWTCCLKNKKELSSQSLIDDIISWLKE